MVYSSSNIILEILLLLYL